MLSAQFSTPHQKKFSEMKKTFTAEKNRKTDPRTRYLSEFSQNFLQKNSMANLRIPGIIELKNLKSRRRN
jgi:hypothetical protein